MQSNRLEYNINEHDSEILVKKPTVHAQDFPELQFLKAIAEFSFQKNSIGYFTAN